MNFLKGKIILKSVKYEENYLILKKKRKIGTKKKRKQIAKAKMKKKLKN